MSNLKWICLFLLWGCLPTAAAQPDLAHKITSIYEQCVFHGEVSDDNAAFIKNVNQFDIEQLTDSAKYAYHYMAGAIMNNEDAPAVNVLPHLESAINLRESAIGIIDIEYVELKSEQARLAANAGDVDLAIVCYEEALTKGLWLMMSQELGVSGNICWQKFNLLNSLGELYGCKGYDDLMVACYHRAFEAGKPGYSADDTYPLNPLLFLGKHYASLKLYESAIAEISKGLTFLRDTGHTQELAYDVLLRQLAIYQHNASRNSDALQSLQEAAQVEQNIYGEVSHFTSESLKQLEEQ